MDWRKTIVIAACLVLASELFFKIPSSIYLMVTNYPHIPQEKVIGQYTANLRVFSDVADYLNRVGGSVTIRPAKNGDILAKLTQESGVQLLDVDETDVKKSIVFLFEKLRYQSILKDEDEDGGSYILFLRKADIGFEQGIAFLNDGKRPSWPLVYLLEQIDNNWHYYESK